MMFLLVVGKNLRSILMFDEGCSVGPHPDGAGRGLQLRDVTEAIKSDDSKESLLS
jgi:hypothetical protein